MLRSARTNVTVECDGGRRERERKIMRLYVYS